LISNFKNSLTLSIPNHSHKFLILFKNVHNNQQLGAHYLRVVSFCKKSAVSSFCEQDLTGLVVVVVLERLAGIDGVSLLDLADEMLVVRDVAVLGQS
jgi:hypothetical protein